MTGSNVNKSFRFLYLNRKYFARDAQFVCLDANYPLPFNDGVFSCVLMIDAIQYITGLALLANQLKRILSSKGLLLLSHVRIALASGTASDKSLPSGFYVNLLKDKEFKLEHCQSGRALPKTFLFTIELT